MSVATNHGPKVGRMAMASGKRSATWGMQAPHPARMYAAMDDAAGGVGAGYLVTMRTRWALTPLGFLAY